MNKFTIGDLKNENGENILPHYKIGAKGINCTCFARNESECGCRASWSDYDQRNKTINEIATIDITEALHRAGWVKKEDELP